MAPAQPASRSSKRKIILSSDSEDNNHEETDGQTQRRSSRIYGKQHKPEFRLPSRDEIWKDIPSVATIQELKKLTPKKTVNNFTKLYHKYNYDDYEDTSDDESSSIETSDSEEEKKENHHRIKNYHKRLQVQSSSSDENDNMTDRSQWNPKQTAGSLQSDPKQTAGSLQSDPKQTAGSLQSDPKQTAGSLQSDPKQTAGSLQSDPDKQNNAYKADAAVNNYTGDSRKSKLDVGQNVQHSTAADSDDGEGSDVLSPSKNAHKRNRSVLVSDDESTENDSKDVDAGECRKEHSFVVESSDSNDAPVESRRCTLEKQKLKQKNMFQKLRDAQAKRKKNTHKT